MSKGIRAAGAVLITGIMLLNGCNQQTDVIVQQSGDKEPVTIKFHSYYNKTTDYWEPVLAAFEKKYPNIHVEFISSDSNSSADYMKKLDLAAASGEDLDVILFGSQNRYTVRAAQGMFEPLNAYMDKDGVDFSSEYTIDTLLGDKYYGLPGKKFIAMVMLNSEHLKESGLPIPEDWTWDDFLRYAQVLTRKNSVPARYGTFFLPNSFSDYLKLALINQPYNNNLIRDDGKTLNIDNPLLRKSLEIRLQAEREHSATPYAEVLNQKLNYRQQYFNQKVSMLASYTYMVPEVGGTETMPAKFKTVFAPYPKASRDDPIMSSVTADILSVNAKSKHKAEAYRFIRWYTTEGIIVQGRLMPSWKKIDVQNRVDSMIKSSHNPEMIDKPSLLKVLNTTATHNPPKTVPYQDEVDNIFAGEVEEMMIGDQEIDVTLEHAREKIKKLIDANTK
ncbi:ABC transporter substrate-binding protein [Paenibacillus periandrae]|uniref:ABC transporter substrate-binding protein n=1 Tax=Paenibacillus periandrae TaxID=1761741 RepID=UPI001F08FF1E|nr:extracellular solute-binding protein [Paenibacillus periandrae]